MKHIVLCALVVSLVPALAADEMQTEIKSSDGTVKAAPLAADGAVKTGPPTAKPPSAADYALRTKVRKRAPFWIDDRAHGAAIRLNKDGTFSSEAQGGGSIAGEWKVDKGELKITWSSGGDQYAYPVAAKGNALTLKGRAPKGNRFKLD